MQQRSEEIGKVAIVPLDLSEIMAKCPPNIDLNKNFTETFSGPAQFSLITVIYSAANIKGSFY